MSKKMSKKDYLAKKAVKQKENQKAALEKTGEILSTRQQRDARDNYLRAFYHVAKHTK